MRRAQAWHSAGHLAEPTYRLILLVKLTKPTIIWEDVLNEELHRSGWPVSKFGMGCLG